MNLRVLAVAVITVWLGGCASRPETPPPPELPSAAATPPESFTPRPDPARVWVYPPRIAPARADAPAVEAMLRAALVRHTPLVTVAMVPAVSGDQAGIPTPTTPEGSRALADQGVHYTIAATLEMGPRGYFSLEERRPPNPIPGWLTSQPVHSPQEAAQAVERTVATLVSHLGRHHQQVTVLFPPAPLTTPPGETDRAGPWEIQAGAFLVPENADRLMEELKNKGYHPFLVQVTDNQGRTWRAVRLGRHQQRGAAEAALNAFERKEGIDAYLAPPGRF